ncbi:MAG: hypothetical protein J6S85_26605 [Methanobrevibacter sp.]|nr:hypothetical protein [Methanobrevibacter sp.]MBO7717166.1 hypothetical protein [Methanobrevibacter sp.]
MDVFTAFTKYTESEKKKLEEKAQNIEKLNTAKKAVEDNLIDEKPQENTTETEGENPSESED